MKYSIGTKLLYIGKYIGDDCSDFKKNQVLIVRKSKYSDSYDFKGRKNEGWIDSFIENPKFFRLLNIVSWKNELED